jgi:hypothetical protein
MVLQGLLQLLPGKLPLRNDVARVLVSLDMHEDAQLKFANLVTGGSK